MAFVIGLLLLVVPIWSLFRLGRRIDDRPANPVLRRLDGELEPGRLDLDRLRRDMTVACLDPPFPEITAPENAAEVREADLCRRLLDGAIAPAGYRQRMSELAHHLARSAGAR